LIQKTKHGRPPHGGLPYCSNDKDDKLADVCSWP
jgi:hypothetical protein